MVFAIESVLRTDLQSSLWNNSTTAGAAIADRTKLRSRLSMVIGCLVIWSPKMTIDN
jgi:hypothetical protein